MSARLSIIFNEPLELFFYIPVTSHSQVKLMDLPAGRCLKGIVHLK